MVWVFLFVNQCVISAQCVIKSDRVLAVKVDNCIFVCVYFPVFRHFAEYESTISNIISILDDIAAQNKQNPCNDFNLQFANGLSQCYAFNNFMASVDLCRCEVTQDTTHTFVCESRNAQSLIHHFLVSSYLVDNVDLCCTVDGGLNFSDHFSACISLLCQYLPLKYHYADLPLCTNQEDIDGIRPT